ncbi:ATP-binding cassette domain-containing protein [Aquisalimonas lutea]|uniref:ATP-binding cassette domain-containing protein n=1 Tax=Aquisalimonas lutea TaxID=1327750 RepID=UPI0025B41178|nr:ATP-binding cassette domain-containing protein [Aquisalimonas lutea]MDN3519407.1 ATP-binding cassette domain-containing protein [Aquisalimonas lutea]
MTLAIETRGLEKRFGDTAAVSGIDLGVERGAVFGLLGPNGAGKTTTIRMLATLLRPTGGSARVLGHDVVKEAARVRAKVSLTGQFASVDEDLTGRENLVLVARLLGFGWGAARVRARELLEAFELSEAGGRQVRTFSGGMRRRLDIAASLVSRPQLLFLDEPTTGLDPRSRNQVWDFVRAIAAEGTTVLLTTQYLEEADRLADRLAVIDQGRVIAEGTSRQLKASVGGRALHVRVADPEQRDRAWALLAHLLGDELHPGTEPDTLFARVTREERVPDALAALTSNGIAVREFALAQPSLDDVFFALTGHGADDETSEEVA